MMVEPETTWRPQVWNKANFRSEMNILAWYHIVILLIASIFRYVWVHKDLSSHLIPKQVFNYFPLFPFSWLWF